jgi:SpoVK/Ycf46/Vps4 family AAA+-type ATPase
VNSNSLTAPPDLNQKDLNALIERKAFLPKNSKTEKAQAKNTPLSPWAQEVAEYVRARFPILYVVSSEEQRCLQELEKVAISLRKRYHIWTETEGLVNPALTTELPDPRSRDPIIMLGGLLKRNFPEILISLDLHVFLENHAVRRRLRDLSRKLLTRESTLIIVAPRLVLPPDIAKDVTVIDVPLPSRDELQQRLDTIASKLTESRKGAVRVNKKEREELLNSAQGMSFHEFEQTLALANIKHGCIDPKAIPLVLREKEQILRKSSILEPVHWDQELSVIGGLDLLKEFLNARREAFSDRAREFGLPMPKGICLIGVQGCGKSLTAKAVANLYRLPLVRMDMGRLFAGLVGKSEENARMALKLAESMAPCVLWIDEIEKGFSGMGSSNMSDGGTTARVIGHMTTWLQERESPVYVVATANDITQLPPELLRKGRFDEIFFVDLPAPIERQEIFRIHLEKRRRVPTDFDTEQLADISRGFSGAEIEQAIISALFEAFNARRPLNTRDIAQAVENMVPLSVMLREKIAVLRTWARHRARRASSMDDLIAEIEQSTD